MPKILIQAIKISKPLDILKLIIMLLSLPFSLTVHEILIVLDPHIKRQYNQFKIWLLIRPTDTHQMSFQRFGNKTQHMSSQSLLMKTKTSKNSIQWLLMNWIRESRIIQCSIRSIIVGSNHMDHKRMRRLFMMLSKIKSLIFSLGLIVRRLKAKIKFLSLICHAKSCFLILIKKLLSLNSSWKTLKFINSSGKIIKSN